ncbi:hypothetical protein ZEAMMB73_Zm00001d019037, partial [Zea mays]
MVALCKLICMPFSNFRTHHPMEDTYGSLYTLWRKQFLACRPRENGLADQLHKKNNGKCCARKYCLRICKHSTKPLPREVGHSFSIQSPKSISSLLEAKQQQNYMLPEQQQNYMLPEQQQQKS